MLDREKVIRGLEFTKEMILFNPSTGECKEPGNLNDLDKTTYDACVGAIAMLEEHKNEYENGFNDAMLGKQELMYEGTDGKWHKKDW